MKPIIGALVLVPMMQAYALAQAPTADAKEGKLYLDANASFGVATMATPATSSTGFDSIALFGAGFGAEFGFTDKVALFTKLGVQLGLENDPGETEFGMTFDVAYKFLERKGNIPALTVYSGIGFDYLDIKPKGASSDNATDIVIEFGMQAEITLSEAMTLQPYAQIQVIPGHRPFKAYNGVLEADLGVKLMIKLTEQLYLVPSAAFVGGNFRDSALFGIGLQLRL